MMTTEENMSAIDDFINSHDLNKTLSIDSDYFDVNYLGDQSLVKDMIKMFINNTPVIIGQIRMNYENKNWKQLYQCVHKVKPTFTMVGLQKVSVICEFIESYVKNEDKPKDSDVLNDFITLLENKAEEALILGKKYLDAK